ncbi:MAG: LAGLIDADG family homing endonuclease [Bacteroidota bacterium]
MPRTTKTPPPSDTAHGLTVDRTFSTEGDGPFDSLEWEHRDAAIKSHTGEVIFEQKDVEFPTSWSQLATNVVASKYFYGDIAAGNGTPADGQREYSLKQLVHRVTRTIADWGRDQHYFASDADAETFYDELTWLCANQYGAFNSPVWFNVGLHHQYGIRDSGGKTIYGWDPATDTIQSVDPYERPQGSACFIISVDDSIDDIWKLMEESARLFKFGSGVGADWSTLRSTHEKLSGGGIPSGPVSFMKVQDATGGTIKSGGKTRRAAIMQTLKSWHPDIREFVAAKMEEEKKAHALIEQGYDGSFNGPAYGSVAFQNVNQSVRVDDAFMQSAADGTPYALRAVTDGATVETVQAKTILDQIAEGTWVCGDPGLQYEDTIQRWHTCPNSAPINSSNPCVTGDTLVATEAGLQRIDALVGTTPKVVGLDGRLHDTTRVIETGMKPVYRLRTRAGYELRLTADHRVWTENRGDVPAAQLTKDDIVRLQPAPFGTETLGGDTAEYVGLVLGTDRPSGEAPAPYDAWEEAVADKALTTARSLGDGAPLSPSRFGTLPGGGVTVAQRTSTSNAAAVYRTAASYAIFDADASAQRLTDRALRLDRSGAAALLRGLFTAAGVVVNYGNRSQYVGLNSTSEELLQQVQLLLLNFGIRSKIVRNRRPLGQMTALIPDGEELREQKIDQMHSLRICRSSRMQFQQEIGFMEESRKAGELRTLNARIRTYRDRLVDRVDSLALLGIEPVYDLTEPATSHFAANGVAVHNCSEYMFLDNSACNLASLNLRKFQQEDGTFDVDRFCAASRIYLTAQEIIVDNAGYPSAKIAKNSHDYRPLGLGFANLGALLMSMGLPYDSDEGRAVAGAIMAMEHCEGYARSAEIAANEKIGPFNGFEANREPFLAVMRMHRDAVAEIDESCPAYLREAAQASADRMVALGEAHGYRNAQATVLAPTGTIGFMMDCDTTGIEPDIALVKYKLLAGKGEGMMKIVNNTVGDALAALGYSAQDAEAILTYVDENDTIEGAPELKDEHLDVFDCAFKPFNGERSIHYEGHIKMMAACQPFISGAISKTVNLPESATPEDIAGAYQQAWEQGVKAVAIYRENSKRSQPLSTKEGGNTKNKEVEVSGDVSGDGALTEAVLGEPEVVERIVYQPIRKRLPDERPSITHKFSIAGHEGYLHIGLYPDSQLPGEIFITMAKQGSTVSGMMDAFATAISLALQYGVPLEDLCSKFSHMRFEPAGFTNNPQVPIAKSIMDYIFRYCSVKFLGGAEPEADPPGITDDVGEDVVNPSEAVAAEVDRNGPAADQVQMSIFDAPTAEVNPLVGQTIDAFMQAADAHAVAEPKIAFRNQEDAPACHVCGSITIRAGACYSCPNCGASTGCG